MAALIRQQSLVRRARRAGKHGSIGEVRRRNHSVDFRHFLATVERSTPAGLDLHLVLDNASTHKTPLIHRWLLRHPRVHLHFTPTSSSWLNLVECWFPS